MGIIFGRNRGMDRRNFLNRTSRVITGTGEGKEKGEAISPHRLVIGFSASLRIALLRPESWTFTSLIPGNS